MGGSVRRIRCERKGSQNKFGSNVGSIRRRIRCFPNGIGALQGGSRRDTGDSGANSSKRDASASASLDADGTYSFCSFFSHIPTRLSVLFPLSGNEHYIRSNAVQSDEGNTVAVLILHPQQINGQLKCR